MKKIINVLFALSIMLNVQTFSYFSNALAVEQITNIQLQGDINTKSTEIAKLGDAIHIQNEKIDSDKMVIDKEKKEIIKQTIETTKLKKEIVKPKKKIFKRKKEGSGVGSRKLTVKATAYIAKCREGCTGMTATGVNVSHSIYYKGHRVIAVDTNIIPLNSLVKVETKHQSFTAMAIDKGGGIDGKEIDLLVATTRDAINFGVQTATLTVLKEGE